MSSVRAWYTHGMSNPQCHYFQTCNAPLCPEDEQSVKFCSWFPDEDICRKAGVGEWVARQKKVRKATDGSWEAGCFTVRMLARRCKIGRGIKGLDPDKGPSWALEDAWLDKRPEFVASEKQRAQSRKRAEELKRSQGSK